MATPSEGTIKVDTLVSWLSDQGYNDIELTHAVEKMQRMETFEGNCWELLIRVSPFSGYSGMYTGGIVDEIEEYARKQLDNNLGFLNDQHERNYDIQRKDFK